LLSVPKGLGVPAKKWVFVLGILLILRCVRQISLWERVGMLCVDRLCVDSFGWLRGVVPVHSSLYLVASGGGFSLGPCLVLSL
jgi:hypothetical protein